MNLDIILSTFVSSMFITFFMFYGGNKLFSTKTKISLKFVMIIIVLTTGITINYLFLNNIAKTSVAFIMVLLVYRILFIKPVVQCAVASFVQYVLLALGEVSFIIVLSLFDLVGITLDISAFIGSIYANLIITLFAIFYLLIIYKPVKKIILKLKDNNRILLIITFSLLVSVNCTLFYKLYFNQCKFDINFAFNVFLVLALAYIAWVIVRQHYDKTKIWDEYERYIEYSKNSERLVNNYSISQHENKNELIIIRSMVHKNNTELIAYLDEIISIKDNIDNSWIRHLRYLPFGGLKGIIHNKILEMKENKINVYLNISKEVEDSGLKELSIKENNQLSKILGVFLDNAKEATMLSEEKSVSVCAYIEQDMVVFEISNSYLEELDLSNIYKIGNTTKGNGRGYGLSLVDSIIKENPVFQNETKIIDKYFVQILKITI